MKLGTMVVAGCLAMLLLGDAARAQSQAAIVRMSENRPLRSLSEAAEAARQNARNRPLVVREIPNKIPKEDLRTQEPNGRSQSAPVQTAAGAAAATSVQSFEGVANSDNGTVLGYIVAPPDTDGDVGHTEIIEMVNSLTLIKSKTGAVIEGPFPSNAFWVGQGGLCEPYNQGDPVVLYDEVAGRWIVSQFAFDDRMRNFAQCVAVSDGGVRPTESWNRYEFSFNQIGFNDYPKHGVVTNSITMTANIFRLQGPFGSFAGTFIGAMDKAAMYAGTAATLVGFNIGTGEFGHLPADLDGGGNVPALFGTAMSRSGLFDIWRIDVNWANPGGATASRIDGISISTFDADLCPASREACVPQPNNGPMLEALSDRLMNRFQVRDFGAHRSFVTSHTVDVGGGRAGIRWYELKETGGSTFTKVQEGTYGPADGKHRWVPSIAMNGAGDIGLGYLMADAQNTYVSIGVTGQTRSSARNGVFDAAETVCIAGTGVQQNVNRAGDYAATAVDPSNDSFWHFNEYVKTTGQYSWNTRFCNFSVGGGTPPSPPAAPTALVASAASSSQINLSWSDNAGNEDGHTIEHGTDGTNFSTLATVGVNVTSYSHTALSPNSTHWYRVRAFNAGGASAYSNTVSATTENAPVATQVLVSSVVTGTQSASKGTKRGTATVTLVDNTGNPVGLGYSVTGDFTGTFNEPGKTATTDGSGVASFTTIGSQKGGVIVDFCVTNVTGGTLPWNGVSVCDAPGKQGGVAALETIPSAYALDQNYPNPFNPSTMLSFMLPEAGHVSLRVFTLQGQEVARLVDGFREEGRHNVLFDGTGLSSGMYLYVLRAGDFVATRHMSLMK